MPSRDRVLSAAELRAVLRLLYRELGARPVELDERGRPDPPTTCGHRSRLSYTRGNRRYCPACWDGPLAVRWPDLAGRDGQG